MSIVARFYPNGEFSHGVDTSRGRKERKYKQYKDKFLDSLHPCTQECRDRYLQWLQANADIDLCVPGQAYLSRDGMSLWVYTGNTDEGIPLYDIIRAKGSDTYGVQMNYPMGRLIGSGVFTPLVHQLVESSPPPQKAQSDGVPSRKRLEAMTSNMARNIRQAAYLLDEMYGKDNISFLTLTLPNLSTDELGLCCERWDYMTDQFLKWLRKRAQKLNMQFQYVYCTEIQTKRLQQRNEYAPHLHIAFRGRYAKKYPWMVTPKQVRKAWTSIISNVVGHCGFDNRALENLQRVRKSIARYLAKYLSKGNCVLPSEGGESPTTKLRTQWGGMARVVSRAIKSCTTRLSGASSCGGLAVRILQEMGRLIEVGLVRYYKPGEIVIRSDSATGVERVLKVGVGCLQYPTYKGGLLKVAEFIQGSLRGGEAYGDIEGMARPARKGRYSLLDDLVKIREERLTKDSPAS